MCKSASQIDKAISGRMHKKRPTALSPLEKSSLNVSGEEFPALGQVCYVKLQHDEETKSTTGRSITVEAGKVRVIASHNNNSALGCDVSNTAVLIAICCTRFDAAFGQHWIGENLINLVFRYRLHRTPFVPLGFLLLN